MPLNKQSGNMYEDITHTWNPIGGECEHRCIYCTTPGNKKPVIQNKYSGKPKLIEHEMKTNLGSGNFIFVTNMADLFAENVPGDVIDAVLQHCNRYPNNYYLFQTKNPVRFIPFLRDGKFPKHSVLDTTIETDEYSMTNNVTSKAPSPKNRWRAMIGIKRRFPEVPRRVTVEPIMSFHHAMLCEMISDIDPEQVYIGANSNLMCKDCGHKFRFRKTPVHCPKCGRNHNITNSDGHSEPDFPQVLKLIMALDQRGISVTQKKNLSRLE